jgi:hypothetical protein
VESEDDFARDSFNKPTPHGALSFELPNSAQFDAKQRFHSWTIELTGTA